MLSIALDFDGVIADTSGAKRNWLRKVGYEIEDFDPVDKTHLLTLVSNNDYQKMQLATGFEDTLNSKPIVGLLPFLKKRKETCIFFIISARDEEKVYWLNTWLKIRDLESTFEEVVSSKLKNRSKLAIASELGCNIFIDNDIRHFQFDEINSIKKVYFSNRGRSQNFDDSIICAKNWMEIDNFVPSDTHPIPPYIRKLPLN